MKDYFMLNRLKDIWPIGASSENSEPDLTRRGALRALMGGAAALALVALPGGNDVQAQDRQTAGLSAGERGLDAVQGRRDMRLFSEDIEKQGIGVFINLRADSSVSGDRIGEWVKQQFAGVYPPISVEYRVNQSKGTATDITFYVRGDGGKPLNVADLQTRLPEVYDRYKGAWLPETSALAPNVSRQ